MGGLTHYYRAKILLANPYKTQVTAFHLGNKNVNRSLKIKWNNSDMESTAYPKYLGITLNMTLSYNEHI